jgi:penicillin-binding protein 2
MGNSRDSPIHGSCMKLGKAFADNVSIEHKHSGRNIPSETPSWWLGAGRILSFSVIVFGCIFLLLFRLFDLTLVRGHEYRLLADGNRTRELVRHAPRGLLVDRTGKPLVENSPRYRLLLPCANGDLAASNACVSYISEEEGKQLQDKGMPAGNFLEVDYSRIYPLSSALAHVLGYTGELTAEELKQEYYELRGYRPGDRVGRSGAEAVFEERIRGRNGKELVEVDSAGSILRVLGRDKEVAGSNVTLSIDYDLSKVVSDAFPKDSKGAVIVSRPKTGEILAMYSNPSYDPNIFSHALSQDMYTTLLTRTDLPLFNRAIGGVYPPGSTFKIITALAGLEEKKITPETVVEDTGVLKVGQFSFANWYFTQYGRTEGAVNLVKAITRSNDIYFYKVGEMTGITNIALWGRKLGIGALQGIELSGEATGLMPDPTWKKQHFTTPVDLASRNDDWYAGDTYHVAIGQGYLLTTPLAVNVWTNVIANRGKLCKPTIEKTTTGTGGHSAICRDIGISKESISVIEEGLKGVCSAGGTAYPFFDFGIKRVKEGDTSASPSAEFIRVPIACKTGTAEFGDPKGKTHAWFTAYGPLPSASSAKDGLPDKTISGDPEISVTVLLEEAGEGSEKAAPVAKKILEEWFKR